MVAQFASTSESSGSGSGVHRPDFDAVGYEVIHSKRKFASHGTHHEWMEENEFYLWHDMRKGVEKRNSAMAK